MTKKTKGAKVVKVEDVVVEPTNAELNEVATAEEAATAAEILEEAGLADDEETGEELSDEEEEKVSARTRKVFVADDGTVDVEVPEGFDFAIHKPLKQKAFTHDKFYFGHRAEGFRLKMEAMIEKRDFAAKFGSKKEQVAVKKMQKLNDKINELKETLEKAGVDPAMIAQLMGASN